MNEPVVSDFEVTTNFLSGELKDQLAAEADSHTAGAGEPAAEAGDDEDVDADGVVPPASTAVAEPKFTPRQQKAKSIQAEIDRDVARRETAKREADAEESRLASLHRRQSDPPVSARVADVQPSVRATVGNDGDDPEPTADQFANSADPYGDHIVARARWAARQEFKQREAAAQQQRDTEARQHEAQTHLAQFETTLKAEVGDIPAFLKSIDNLTEKLVPFIGLADGTKPTGYTAIADSLLVAGQPGKLLIHLHAHPDEFQRIGSLPPNQALREVGILEGTLRAAPASSGPGPRAFASAAPPPTKPLGSSPRVSSDSDDDLNDMSPEAQDRWIRRENSKETRRRAPR